MPDQAKAAVSTIPHEGEDGPRAPCHRYPPPGCTFYVLSDTVLPLARRRVLIIDDEPSARGALQRALEEAGAEVWTAGDGHGPSALQLMEAALPDLVLIDTSAPGTDAGATLDWLRGSPRTAELPVVLVTKSRDLPTFELARKLGVAAFVAKPFRVREVVGTVRGIVEGARPLQGRPALDQEGPCVQVRKPGGALLGMGRLLDLDERGAQLDFDRPLPSGERFLLVLSEGGSRTLEGEIRWVRRSGDTFHHGVRFELG